MSKETANKAAASKPMTGKAPASKRGWKRPLVALAALVGAVVVVVLLATGGGDDGAVSLAPDEPQVVTSSELSDIAAGVGHPVYWLGEREGTSYEVTETGSGRFYVRYLSGDAKAGDKRAEFLTVGTYPANGGVAALRRAVRNRAGARLAQIGGGATLLIDPSSPMNAHLAYRGSELQVEVFGPVPGQALRLASSGHVEPVAAG
jgi:hypothetical protein